MRVLTAAAGVFGTVTLVAMGASFGVGNLSVQNASAGVVQSFGAKNTTLGTSLQATPGVSTVSGDLLVATIRTREASGAAATVTGVTDSAGNTWAKATSVLQGTPNDGEIWYVANAISDTSVTVAVSAAAAVTFTVVEVSGAATTAVLDRTVTASGSSTAPAVGPSATTTQANEIVIADIGWNTSLTPTGQSSSYTVTAAEQSSVSGDNSGEQAAYQILSATGAQTYAAGIGSPAPAWTGTIATFYLGSGAPTPTPTASSTPTPSASPTNNPTSEPHIMLIVEENQAFSSAQTKKSSKDPNGYIIGNTAKAPYLNTLATTYASATNWYAVQHNSPHDYLDLIVGADLGLPNGTPYSSTTLVDELHSANIPWVSYMESMPSDCFTGTTANALYDPNHNPFHYFDNYKSSTAPSGKWWCSSSNLSTEGVLPYPGASGIASALDASNAPDFVYLVPNDCDDMHGDGASGSGCPNDTTDATNTTLIADGDTWLSNNLPSVLGSTWFKQNGTVIITWDESIDGDSTGCCGLSSPGGQVPTLVISAASTGLGNFTSTGDHYGALRAIEEQYGVAKLGGSSNTVNGDLTPAFGHDGTISGTVNDSVTNTGINGATVSISGNSTTTNSSGGYELTAVPPGTYTVTASATGHANGTASVTVTAGSNSTVNFSLTSSAGSITGTVLDTQNPAHPVANATITYTGGPATTTTNASGVYTLTGITPGTYTVTATQPGYATGTDTMITVTAGHTATANFTMAATSSIGGTVLDTESPTGLPVTGATVAYTGPNGSGSTSVINAVNGAYSLVGVPAGTYTVTASATGFTSVTNSGVIVTVSGTATSSFTMTANSSIGGALSNSDGSAVSGVTVTYTGTSGSTGTGSVTTSSSPYTLAGVPPGTYSVSASEAGFISPPSQNVTVSANGSGTANFVMEAVGTISGTVTNGSAGLRNATVTYAGPDGSGHTITSDSNGDYSLTDVPDGAYSVTASDLVDGSYQPKTFTVTVTGTATSPLSFILSLGSNGSIAGSVTDAQTSLPLANVSVSDGVGGTATTDSSGNYVIENVVPGSSYTVTFTATSYATGSLSSVTVATDANTQKNIALNEDGTISGTVTNANTSTGINGATVTCAQCPLTTASTGPSGSYTFMQVPPGSGYIVSVVATGFNGQTSAAFSVTPNGTSTTNFNLTPTPAGLSVPETFGAANSGATGGASWTALPSNPTGLGDLLVATIKLRVLSGTSTVSTVTDSAGNVWTKGPTVTQGSGLNDEEVWYVAGAASVSSSQTNPGVTVTTTTAAAISFTVLDVAGASGIDQSKTSFGSSFTPQPSVATTTATTQANEIVIGDFGWNGTAAMSGETFSPLTSPVTLGVQQSTVTNTKTEEQAAYQSVSSTGTWSFSGTLNATSAWTGIIVTFH